MRIRSFLVTAITLVLLNDAASAQDEADVRAAIERHYAAIHAGDTATRRGHHLPEFSIFPHDGRMLLESGFEDAFERMGFTMEYVSTNTYINHFNAQVYGDVAVATFYLVGSHTWGEETANGAWRVTAVWVREGGDWKEAHHHESPLEGGKH
jgi:ketosteroid isomerase-like protein